MEALLAEIGLEAEFVAAVDGRRLTAADRKHYDSRLARLNYRSEMTDAEIACYLSHYRIYERICQDDLDVALILEDDIDASPALTSVLRDLLADPDPAWSVVRLQTQRGRVFNPGSSRDLGREIGPAGGGTLYRLDTHVLGGCAYLMRREAARTMVSYGRKISRPIDHTLDRFWENGILPYVVRPFPVRQHPAFQSEIGVRGKAACPDERPLDAVRGRLRRARDGINKRIFRTAVRYPAVRDMAGLALSGMALLSQVGQTRQR